MVTTGSPALKAHWPLAAVKAPSASLVPKDISIVGDINATV